MPLRVPSSRSSRPSLTDGLWLLLLVLLPMAAQAQTPAATFALQATPSTGVNSSPLSVAIADVNGDGKLDALTANYLSSTLGVLLGDGAGGFTLQATSPSTGANSRPGSVAIADVNGDGKLDALTANNLSNTLGVLLGDGAGGFTLQANAPSSGGSLPTSVAIADVNGDGKLDALTTNNNNRTLGVLLGNGAGGFTLQVTSPSTGVNSGPYSVAIADVNGDSKLDALTVNYNSSTLGVLLGDGAGGFTLQATSPSTGTNSSPTSVAIADVNGDGKPDALTANSNSNTLGVLLGDGAGGFTLQATSPSTGANSSPYSVAIADVNGDGKLDALTANYLSSTLGVLLGNGAGGFTLQANTSFTGTNSGPYNVAIADVNGDGKLDALTANSNSNTLGVLLNRTVYTTPTFTSLSPNPATVGTSVTLTGTNLTGATAVRFNGTAATTFAVVNSTTITATVPTGATSGLVTVTTPGGTSNGVPFTVLTNAPVVTAPANNATTNGLPTYAGTAPAGSTLTIYLALGSGAAQAIGTTTATGGSFSLAQPTALASGTYSVYATAQSSGASVSANSNTNPFTVDATPPTATISTISGSPTSTTPIPFTVTFSEPVVGFSASGLSVTNGTITSAITSAGNAYSFSVTPTANGAVVVSVLVSAAQDMVGNPNAAAGPLSVTYVSSITATTWTGAVSTDWYTAGNWTAGVPTATLDALVPVVSSGLYPVVNAGTASVRGLTLNSGVTLSQGGGTISLRGDLTNNGTFKATGGTVATTGSTAQTLGGSSPLPFWSLNIGAASATLGTSATFQRVLTLTGNLTTNGQSLTLLSSTSGGVATDGLVVNNGGVVVGTATVQRAIDPSVNPGIGYRHYSAPVSNSTVGDLATSGFTPVVNPAFNTVASPYTITPYPTVYGYDDSRLSLTNNLDMFDKGYYSPTALSDPLAVGRGYTVNIGASELVDFQGTLNTGDRTLNLTSTRNNYSDGGWQFLGNPYPAPLDYSRVAAADRLGLESAIYVYSSTSQYFGRYRAYINGIGNPVLPLGQGFFARVANGQATANMTFRNSQRLSAPNGTTMQRTTADPRPLVQLTLQGASPALADEAYVYFENGATSGFEPEFDAEKLANSTGLNLSTNLATGQHLSIDGQPELGTAQRVVPLAVGVPAVGVYTFTASQLLNLSAVPVYLRDLQLGTLTDLRQQPTYQFTVSNAAALNTTRFALVFSPQQPLATAPAALAEQAGLYPNPAKTTAFLELPASLGRQAVTATLVDALGRVVRTVTLPAQGAQAHQLDLHELPTGVYALRLTTSAGPIVKRLTVE